MNLHSQKAIMNLMKLKLIWNQLPFFICTVSISVCQYNSTVNGFCGCKPQVKSQFLIASHGRSLVYSTNEIVKRFHVLSIWKLYVSNGQEGNLRHFQYSLITIQKNTIQLNRKDCVLLKQVKIYNLVWFAWKFLVSINSWLYESQEGI